MFRFVQVKILIQWYYWLQNPNDNASRAVAQRALSTVDSVCALVSYMPIICMDLRTSLTFLCLAAS